MGEEIGMKEGRLKRHEIMDPPGRRYWPFFKGRDGARTPMQWNRAEYSGFSSTKPWLRVNPDYAHLNVEFQSVNPDSLLNHYRKLIRLRKDHAALRCGSLKMLDSHPDVLAYMREGKSENLAVCLNFSNEVRTVTIKGFESRKAVRIFSYPYISAPEISCSRITVPPYGVMIIAV
jgi:alpha-glucosidase